MTPSLPHQFLNVCLAALLTLLAAGQAERLEAAKPAATALRAFGVEEPELSITLPDRRLSLETGLPLALYRVDEPVAPGAPEDMAREYLSRNRSQLGLEMAGLEDLEHSFTRAGDAGTTVRFRQHVAGVPVYRADLAVTIDPRGRVSYVTNGYRPRAGLAGVTPSLSREKARALALAAVEAREPLSFERVRLVVYAGRGGARLAWEVRFVPVDGPPGEWEVLVDAHTGELFRLQDVALYAPVNGTGNVFDPDPLTSSGATYGDPGFVDGSDADTAQLSGQTFSRTLQEIDLTGGIHKLEGPWAEIVDFDPPFNGLFTQASSNFNFSRSQDGFEATNVYFHIDTFMRYMNLTLGCNIQPHQYPGGVQFDPSGFSGADNSSYNSGSGQLRFGEGGVDDAEDADVVIHELGHGIHDWVTGGNLSQVEGLSEGTGDYLASSYNRSFGFWTPADAEYNWMFHWDGHNPFWSGRITNYFPGYPGGLTGSIHTDGQIWSSCNMLIWDSLGRELTDKAFLEGLGMTGGGTNQQDAAQAVLQAAANLGYSGSQLATMEGHYQGCGYNVTAPCGVDGFESDDTSGSASTLSVVAPQTHSICAVGDQDWATFELPSAAEVIVETSGTAGDTFLTLFDGVPSMLETDDNGGSAAFSKIDRLCGVDELPAGTYFVKVNETGDDAEILEYLLDLTVQTCACPDDLVLANQTLSGTITYRAAMTATLGPNLLSNGTGIGVLAKDIITMEEGTTVDGGFEAGLDPDPCP